MLNKQQRSDNFICLDKMTLLVDFFSFLWAFFSFDSKLVFVNLRPLDKT